MTILYDIHTHKSLPIQDHSYSIRYILNTQPTEIEILPDVDHCKYYSCGVHPWYADDWKEQIYILKKLATNSSIVAIGECGLDRIRGLSMDMQIEIFKEHIAISEIVTKPLIIHCVRAWDILLKIRKEVNPAQPWILHGFRGKASLAKQLVLSGMYLSIGSLFNEESISEVPIDKLFLETDDSEKNIVEVYNRVSDILNVSANQLAALIAENVKCVFNLHEKH